MIYLDNAATTRIAPEVLNKMLPYLQDEYGNPGSLHTLGRKANIAVETARKKVADFINADPSQIIFTSGGTEANNMVFNRIYVSDRVALVSSGEHDSVIRSSNKYLRRITIPLDSSGKINYEDFLDYISVYSPRVEIVSVMHTNNETGAVNDVSEISKECHNHSIKFHTDCVQAAGFSKIDVKKIGCDYLSISSHKIHGPKGIGALYLKDRSLFPLIYGGSMQEFGLRGGTENVASIVGFGEACALAGEHLYDNVAYLSTIVGCFSKTLLIALEAYGLEDIFHVNGFPLAICRKTYSLRFDGIPNETLLVMLDARGVCVSAGSACTASDHKASHVLTAMGLTEEEANNTIRVSFSAMNTVEEVEKAAQIIADCVNTLKNNI